MRGGVIHNLGRSPHPVIDLRQQVRGLAVIHMQFRGRAQDRIDIIHDSVGVGIQHALVLTVEISAAGIHPGRVIIEPSGPGIDHDLQIIPVALNHIGQAVAVNVCELRLPVWESRRGHGRRVPRGYPRHPSVPGIHIGLGSCPVDINNLRQSVPV